MPLSAGEGSGLASWAEVLFSLGVGGFLGLCGGMVGLVLGNLRLPAVFFLVGSAPIAAGTNIGISGISAAGGVWRHWRDGSIRWRVFLTMAPPSAVGAFAGGFFSNRVDAGLLLVIISVIIVQGGVGALLQARSARADARRAGPGASQDAEPPSAPRQAAKEAGIGLVIGGLGGLVGLILGSLRLPAMLRFLGMQPRFAVGTNMAVGLATGMAGLAGHLAGGGIDWTVLVTMGGASAVGSYYGARLTGRMSRAALLTALGVVLLVVAGAMFWQAVLEL